MADKISISGHTRVLGLLGSDGGHSLAPEFHNASFDEMGEDLAYVMLNIKAEDLVVVVPGLTALGLVGYNVADPFRRLVRGLLDELSLGATLSGAVNTVAIVDGKTTGHNTLGAGFMRNVAEQGHDIIGKKMTIVGAGGASPSVITQAALDGVAEIDVFIPKDKEFDRLAKKLARVAEETQCRASLHDLADTEDFARSVAEADIFVNALCGSAEDAADQCPLTEDLLHEGLIVADTVYSPGKTKLMEMAEAHGNPAIPALGMLLWDASLAEEIWTGKQMNIDHVIDTLRAN